MARQDGRLIRRPKERPRQASSDVRKAGSSRTTRTWNDYDDTAIRVCRGQNHGGIVRQGGRAVDDPHRSQPAQERSCTVTPRDGKLSRPSCAPGERHRPTRRTKPVGTIIRRRTFRLVGSSKLQHRPTKFPSWYPAPRSHFPSAFSLHGDRNLKWEGGFAYIRKFYRRIQV